MLFVFFFQAEDGIRDGRVTGVQTCALPIYGIGGSFRMMGTALPSVRSFRQRKQLVQGVNFMADENDPVERTTIVETDGGGGGEIGRASCREKGRARWWEDDRKKK